MFDLHCPNNSMFTPIGLVGSACGLRFVGIGRRHFRRCALDRPLCLDTQRLQPVSITNNAILHTCFILCNTFYNYFQTTINKKKKKKDHPLWVAFIFCVVWQQEKESNLELILRRDLLYPFNYSRKTLVPRVGLEPTLLTEGDFESPASTNSATWA